MSKITYLTARWCQPCKTYLPLVRAAAAERGHEMQVLDIDDPGGAAMAAAVGVMRVPALVIGDDVHIGPRTPRQVAAILEEI